jgi:hypothetical protein
VIDCVRKGLMAGLDQPADQHAGTRSFRFRL